MRTLSELNDMQQKFVDEYMKDFNATRAAIRAGYSEKTAHVQGPRLLGNVRVRQEIDRLKAEMRDSIQEHFVLHALTAQKVMLKILNNPSSSDRDRIAAAKDFLDRAGYVPTSKQEITGTNGGAIQIVFKEPDG